MKSRRIGLDRLNFMPNFVWKQKSALISCRLNFMSPCFHVALISCFKVLNVLSVDPSQKIVQKRLSKKRFGERILKQNFFFHMSEKIFGKETKF